MSHPKAHGLKGRGPYGGGYRSVSKPMWQGRLAHVFLRKINTGRMPVPRFETAFQWGSVSGGVGVEGGGSKRERMRQAATATSAQMAAST